MTDVLAADDEVAPPDAEETSNIDRQLRTLLEWVAVAIGALAVALVLRATLVQAYYIPSSSMTETLVEGDRVLVNKLSYRLHDVNRGDVVVFSKPPGTSGDIDDLIKRVVALPGETVTLVNGTVQIDGVTLLEDNYLGAETITSEKVPIPGCANEVAARDRCVVPEGHVFVLGDNRSGSSDSRVFGPIEEDSIIGRAFLKVWPLGDVSFL